MSRRQGKHEKGGGPRGQNRTSRGADHSGPPEEDHRENVVRRLAELFQDSFDLEIIQSVAQTCQWDFGKATEAMIVLGGSTQPPVSRRTRRVNSLVDTSTAPRYKTKSLPGTLKGHKSPSSGRLSDSSTHSMPNGLRAHPAYFSNDSLASGQVWQRHYKSKPQSPGLLTMIPPSPKDKPSKPSSSRSSSRASSIKELPEVKEASQVILRIQKLVQSNVKVLILMRGVPGSGKTHLAQVVVQMVAANDRGQHICSTDDYFVMIGRGVYAYDANQLPQAHNWNQKRVSEALRRAVNPVVVDNTNLQAWEMKPYVAMGVQHGYHIEVLEPVTPWRMREADLVKRNTHNVPREKIRQMLDRYEPGWTGEKLLNLFQFKYQDCGSAHVSPEITNLSNSPLAQHRQHSAEKPEKPKRKKASPGKKDRRRVPGVEINTNQEQQLEELNKIFAEYGKTIDPESRQKVIEAGVPIFEVVSRIRKMQGTVLPLPGVPPSITEEEPTDPSPPTIQAEEPAVPVNDYFGLRRVSPTESVEPESSSNSPETSDCESDSEPEPLRRYLDDCGGHFVNGEDQWEDEEEAKSDGAVSGRSGRPISQKSGLMTSSQEELSIIDYQMSTPAGSSQDELSLLEFQRGCTPNGSTTSSEEPKTELSTLQDSLRDVLLRSAATHQPEPAGQLMRDIASQTGSKTKEEENLPVKKEKPPIPAKPDLKSVIRDTVDNIDVATNDPVQPVVSTQVSQEAQLNSVDLNDSLMEILKKRFLGEDGPKVDEENNVLSAETAKSPDLEEIPLPKVPEEDRSGKMRPKLETILESAQSPPDTEIPAQSPRKAGILSSVLDSINWSNLGKDPVVEAPKPQPPRKPEPRTNCDRSTNTEPGDFELWRENGPHKVLTTFPRTINDPLTLMPVRSMAAVAMFDKGTETMAEDGSIVMEQEGLQILAAMFPDVAILDLADLLEKCQYDIQWAAELITDQTIHNMPSTSVPQQPPPQDLKLDSIIADGKKTIKRRKDKKSPASEISQLLKKEIESSFQISDEHYSDHVLFIKKVREGEIDRLDRTVEPEAVVQEESIQESTPNELPSTPEGEAAWEAEPQLAMPLDPSFLAQLIGKFGGPGVAPGQTAHGFKPVIRIPESLGRALYWLWVESLSEQVADAHEAEEDEITQADALLAAALQEEELQNRPPSMQEILDLDLAEKLMIRDHERASGQKADTVAAVLSKKLLIDKYPHLDKEALMQVFKSEGYSLQQTCNTLHALYGPPKQVPIQSVPAHSDNGMSYNKPLIVVKEPSARNRLDDDVLVVDPSAFRLEIQRLQQKRLEYQRQGKEEMAKKNYAVASHFFQEARNLKEQIQEKQATSIASQHPFNMSDQDLPTTLDLHYLFTHEAIQFVDLFLDLHITRLSSGRQDLYLITGRGKNSLSGMSRIKPVVQKRLTERQLSVMEENPGMIRVTVHGNDLLSAAL